ncbi:hypothetical protein [Cetobacterium sp.]|uniref:hypothetical protein n=1 Tax=Cetobacterium sp. TaxID=2071632 RepID=UPI002FC601EA
MVVETISNKTYEHDYSIDPNSVDGVLQQCRLILSTIRGAVPLERDLGMDPKAIDKPSNLLIPGLKVDIQQQFKRFVPRATVLGIDIAQKDEQIEILVTVGVRDE